MDKNLNKKLKGSIIMNENFYLVTNDSTINVIGTIDTKKEPSGVLISGKGYIDENDRVWIFSSGKPNSPNKRPYFWIEDGEVHFSNPEKSVFDTFNKKNLKNLDVNVIINNTKEGEVLLSEKAIIDTNASAEVYVPTILESDDFLKLLSKRAIIDKGINIARLKYKMPEKYVLPNMKAAMQGKTKMSTVYFETWAELLGFDFELIIKDNGTDPQNPLEYPLKYVSRRGKVYRITEDGEEEV